jgi:hypothetical protein
MVRTQVGLAVAFAVAVVECTLDGARNAAYSASAWVAVAETVRKAILRMILILCHKHKATWLLPVSSPIVLALVSGWDSYGNMRYLDGLQRIADR